MYGYEKDYRYGPTGFVETWEIDDGYDGGTPRCRECGQRTEVFSSGNNRSVIVCASCNISAQIDTRSMNQTLARSRRIVFPISPKRRW